MAEAKKLSIIIVAWNVRELLSACLASITRNVGGDLSWQVIIVDNNSTDGTQELLREKGYKILGRENCILMFNKENNGFAQGNNQGLSQASGEYVLFLNPDTEVIGDALRQMVKFMDEHQEGAALGPKLINPDGSLQLSVRKFPDLISQLLILTKLHNFWPRLKPLRNYFQLDIDYTKTQPVDQVMGAALMLRRSVIESPPLSLPLGKGEKEFFDPRFKRIFEEVDLCRRIKNAGYKIIYFPGAQIMHHKGASFHGSDFKPSLKRQWFFNHDLLYYFKKHEPRWHYYIMLLILPLNYCLVIISQLTAWLLPATKKWKKREF